MLNWHHLKEILRIRIRIKIEEGNKERERERERKRERERERERARKTDSYFTKFVSRRCQVLSSRLFAHHIRNLLGKAAPLLLIALERKSLPSLELDSTSCRAGTRPHDGYSSLVLRASDRGER